MTAEADILEVGSPVQVLNLVTGLPRKGVRYVVAIERGGYRLANRPSGKPGPVLWDQKQIVADGR